MNKKESICFWVEKCGKAILSALILVQSVLCIIYLWKNGMQIQLFEESLIYLDSSLSGVTNGWQLIGYSVLITFFRGFMGNQFLWGIMGFQLLITIAVFAYALNTWADLIWEKKISVFEYIIYIAFFITNPFVFQMVLAVLPDILSLDLFMVSLSLLLHMLQGEARYVQWEIIGLIGCVLALALLDRYYLWAIVVTIFVTCLLDIWVWKKNNKKNLQVKYVLLCCGMIVAITLGFEVNHYTSDNSQYMNYSLIADLMDRVVYPDLSKDIPSYSSQITSVVSKDFLNNNKEKLYQMKEVIGPFLEKTYGKKIANKVYLEMVQVGLRNRTKEILKNYIQDMLFHITQIFMSAKILLHNHDSRYGYNLSRMWDGNARLTMSLFHFGILIQIIMGISEVIKTVIIFLVRRKNIKIEMVCMILISALIYTSVATLFAPVGSDYRLGLCFLCTCFILAFGEESPRKAFNVTNEK